MADNRKPQGRREQPPPGQSRTRLRAERAQETNWIKVLKPTDVYLVAEHILCRVPRLTPRTKVVATEGPKSWVQLLSR